MGYFLASGCRISAEGKVRRVKYGMNEDQNVLNCGAMEEFEKLLRDGMDVGSLA